MSSTMKWLSLSAVATCLALLPACGANQTQEAPAGEEGSLFQTSLALPTSGAAPQLATTVKLADYWAAERFEQDHGDPVVMSPFLLGRELLTRAQPDECFNGIGGAIGKPPCQTGEPKTNQAYVWGLTRYDTTLFFGTIANVPCLVAQGIAGPSVSILSEGVAVCEGSQSRSGTGDFRPPDLWKYDLKAHTRTSLNPTSGPAAVLRRTTTGIRSAATMNGVVFLAGPSMVKGINLFAFDAKTGSLLGAQNLPAYGNVRNWIVAGGALYTGVSLTSLSDPTAPQGALLRWRGERSTDPSKLFKFEVVGLFDADAANLTQLAGHVYVLTWPNQSAQSPRPSALFRSPELGNAGLTDDDATQWKRLWTITDYDPDPICAATTGGGAISAYEGRLFFGTMHVPALATSIALRWAEAGTIDLDANGNHALDSDELLATALGTHRATSYFTVESPDSAQPNIKVLYGEKYLPVYDASARSYTIAYDSMHLNKMQQTPVWGASGFGNFFNAYTWTSTPYDDDLFIGTFDWTSLAAIGVGALLGVDVPENALAAEGQMFKVLGTRLPRQGADLFRMPTKDGEVVAESLTGLGNDMNYGVRSMLTDCKALYVGTANPANLSERGGWELFKLTPE